MKEFFLERAEPAKALTIDYKKELNPEQYEVVTQGDGPCLVLAGAGSGKTRTITYRLAYLVERGVAPENILLVTFTNKAAREMVSRVEELLHGYPAGLWSGTFHSVANRILRANAAKIGFSPNFTILDAEDATTFIKVCLKDLRVDTKARRFPSPAVLSSMISYARNACRPVGEVLERKYPHFVDIAPTLERLAELYAARKKTADAMDFDDLLIHVRDLLAANPVVRDHLGGQFRYILVDEYQDTNRIQAEIIHALAGVHRNLLVVGDDAQSIYSFRAAEIRNILDFPNHYENAKTFRLTTNYRSTPEILSVANEVIRQNAEQFKKELRAVCASSERPSLIPSANAPQEAAYIASQILELRDEGVPLRNIAVLFRAAFHSQALEMELMKRDIPYDYRGGMKFFERAHVKDVICYLRLLVNAKDEMAWTRVLGHQPGIGLVTAGAIVRRIQTFDALSDILIGDVESDLPTRAQSGWRSFLSIARSLGAAQNPADAIRNVAGSGYRDYLEAEYPDAPDRLDDLEQLALFAEQYADTKDFLDEVSLTSDYGAVREKEDTEDEEKMVLSTIHQAKGLEWDAVFVMNLADGSFPNQKALTERGGLEEERRLFYVAVTRARKHLFLTYPITAGYDTLMVQAPSMFLNEIPRSLLEEVRLRETVRRAVLDAADEEPTIVLDADGERVVKPPSRTSFLRDISEL